MQLMVPVPECAGLSQNTRAELSRPHSLDGTKNQSEQTGRAQQEADTAQSRQMLMSLVLPFTMHFSFGQDLKVLQRDGQNWGGRMLWSKVRSDFGASL